MSRWPWASYTEWPRSRPRVPQAVQRVDGVSAATDVWARAALTNPSYEVRKLVLRALRPGAVHRGCGVPPDCIGTMSRIALRLEKDGCGPEFSLNSRHGAGALCRRLTTS